MFPGTSNRFDWLCPADHNEEEKQKLVRSATFNDSTTLVLLEIVGAIGLSNKTTTYLDPYCVVKVGCEEVHRTKAIKNDGNPIWTVKTNSISLLEIPRRAMSSGSSSGTATPTSSSDTTDSSTNAQSSESTAVALANPQSAEDTVTIEICHGMKRLGTVTVSFDQVLQAVGDRVEYAVQPAAQGSDRNINTNLKAVLALRFRRATRDDLIFLGKIKASPAAPLISARDYPLVASDIDFKNGVRQKCIFQSTRMVTGEKEFYKVMPYPDPSRPKETEWMTKDAIHEEALKPSVRWAQSGFGTMGTVYLEIVGCDNLPNLDLGMANVTDPFVGIVYEDNFVRTDVIWDQLNPRWMPWTTRAFAFQVRHPSSILMLAVFDYDEAPLDSHDPVGNVIINPANFECDTTYLLHYQLHHCPLQEDVSTAYRLGVDVHLICLFLITFTSTRMCIQYSHEEPLSFDFASNGRTRAKP
jgi:hypothetical protein